MLDKKDAEDNGHEREFVEDHNDDTYEETDLAEIEGTATDAVRKAKVRLKECEHEKRELNEALQRTKADYLNTKRRLEERHRAETDRLTESFVTSLLPLCDSFEMAMSDKATWEAFDEKWRAGIEAIRAQLDQLLREYAVTVIDPTGEPFDPQLHEAVATETVTDEHSVDTVVRVLQKGYQRHESVIRPAKVAVGSTE